MNEGRPQGTPPFPLMPPFPPVPSAPTGGIGNRLHRVPDVVFHDDLMHLRTDNGPGTMATIQHMAMNLIRNAGGKHSRKVKRKAAAWDHDHLKALMTRTTQ
ncbi:MAG: hypothetical protein LW703_06730 [Rhodobacter sp.]|nr:hypothetical protein [Rhodobacter sp.]